MLNEVHMNIVSKSCCWSVKFIMNVKHTRFFLKERVVGFAATQLSWEIKRVVGGCTPQKVALSWFNSM